ncbi:CapA family protein [Romboutsia sp.]|uniref:CapA family protein n=1 Tax=Romboutsia sp. TaxID=1965302 RepID=UPI002B5A218F|nr:CapA family protein [Romboutsia sp.]HSQ90290.1 CapA family protein [Romboutsia sp.]
MSRVKRNKNKKIKSRIRIKKLVLFLSLLVLFASFLVMGMSKIFENRSKNTINHKNHEVIQAITTSKSYKKINLNTVGDVMAHKPQLQAQYDASSKSYNFDNNFQCVGSFIEKSDLSIANLETTLAGPSIPYTSYPAFNSPDTLIDALKNAGIDVLSTINNHSFDKGDLGVKRTLQVTKEKGVETVGTVQNLDDKNYIIKDINDIILGITSFSYGEIKNGTKYVNGIQISNESKDKMNIFDMYSVDNAFNTIKEQLDNIKNTDIQIVILHWGNEYQRAPSEFQTKLAQKLSDYGVDIIIGSHPHVVQPVEMIKSSNGTNDTLVIYSLGNFLSNQRKELLGSPFTEDGLMVNIEITKDFNENKTYVSQVECVPTWINKYQKSGKDVYEIIPIYDKNQLDTIENLPISQVKASYNNTISQIKQSNIIKTPANPF